MKANKAENKVDDKVTNNNNNDSNIMGGHDMVEIVTMGALQVGDEFITIDGKERGTVTSRNSKSVTVKWWDAKFNHTFNGAWLNVDVQLITVPISNRFMATPTASKNINIRVTKNSIYHVNMRVPMSEKIRQYLNTVDLERDEKAACNLPGFTVYIQTSIGLMRVECKGGYIKVIYKSYILEGSVGNLKIGLDTIIINFTSAKGCPSLLHGYCHIPQIDKSYSDVFGKHRCKCNSVCYAMNREVQYEGVRQYRNRQFFYWYYVPENIAMEMFRAMLSAVTDAYGIRFIRLSEAGDVYNQRLLDIINSIAGIARKEYKVRTYGYTCARNLDFSNTDNINWKGSDFKAPGINGDIIGIDPNSDTPAGYYRCPGNCRKCAVCKITSRPVAIPIH